MKRKFNEDDWPIDPNTFSDELEKVIDADPSRLNVFDVFLDNCQHDPEHEDCWTWVGKMYGGYPVYPVGEDTGTLWVSAKRAAYFLKHGFWPKNHVTSRCKYRRCVNPEHLDILSGSVVANSKLTKEAVQEIRGALKIYGYRKILAKKFGVSISTITSVLSERSWRS